jgi:hypothetical protein
VSDRLLLEGNSGAVALAHWLSVIIHIYFICMDKIPGNEHLCEREE